MLEIHEQAWFHAFVGLVDEHGAVPEQGLEAFERQVDYGIEQWVAGCNSACGWPAISRLLECNARIAVEHRVWPMPWMAPEPLLEPVRVPGQVVIDQPGNELSPFSARSA
jgi:hypothetical protein